MADRNEISSLTHNSPNGTSKSRFSPPRVFPTVLAGRFREGRATSVTEDGREEDTKRGVPPEKRGSTFTPYPRPNGGAAFDTGREDIIGPLPLRSSLSLSHPRALPPACLPRPVSFPSLSTSRRLSQWEREERRDRSASTYYYGLLTRRALTSKVVLTRLHVLRELTLSLPTGPPPLPPPRPFPVVASALQSTRYLLLPGLSLPLYSIHSPRFSSRRGTLVASTRSASRLRPMSTTTRRGRR